MQPFWVVVFSSLEFCFVFLLCLFRVCACNYCLPAMMTMDIWNDTLLLILDIEASRAEPFEIVEVSFVVREQNYRPVPVRWSVDCQVGSSYPVATEILDYFPGNNSRSGRGAVAIGQHRKTFLLRIGSLRFTHPTHTTARMNNVPLPIQPLAAPAYCFRQCEWLD